MGLGVGALPNSTASPKTHWEPGPGLVWWTNTSMQFVFVYAGCFLSLSPALFTQILACFPTICFAAFPSILFYQLAIWPQHPFHSAWACIILILACFPPQSFFSASPGIVFVCSSMISKNSNWLKWCCVLVNHFASIILSAFGLFSLTICCADFPSILFYPGAYIPENLTA